MRRKSIILAAVLVLSQLCSSLWALPRTAYEAEMAVAGWLKVDPQPLDTALGQEVMRVETFTDEYGEPVYYIVYLEPSGFVIVSADDMVEPIIGFADDGTYDPSLENPLGALVTNDLNGRMAAVHRTFSLQAMVGKAPFTYTQRKWSYFISLGETSEGGFSLMGRRSIPDVRVAPLVQSKWNQEQVCDNDCYNYYTPDNYPCGCLATTMAQLMRYYQHPTARIGVHEFTIQVDDVEQTASTRGGNGNGGAYKWNQMELEPDCSTTLAQRKAIGALCYDAGISINSYYTADSSGALLFLARFALQDTFQYGNAIMGLNFDFSAEVLRDLGSGLEGMVNPNLDAGHPVILGLWREGDDAGHSTLADGYGYNSSTLYHHLNMGWGGIDDAWYSLPIIGSDPSYNVVDQSIYNIFTSGSGEIISGRVTDAYGSPISGTTVTATRQGSSETYTDETDSKGIYALEKVKSRTTYTISATKSGYVFTSQDVLTGKSEDLEPVSGNRWGVDFKASLPPSGPMEDFETNNFRKFPWEHEGDSHWTTTSWEKHSGNYSAQAGSIDHDESTSLKVTLNCVAGDITFYCKIYSEVGCDYLTFYIDGVEKDTWSGEEDWAEVSFPATAGTRTFEWTYSKDGSVSEGDDTVWIDDIVFPVQVQEHPPPPPPTPTPNLVGWWRFNEGSGTIATDSSGNERHGVLVDGPQWVDGIHGSALEFDAGQHVAVPGYEGILGSRPRTTCAWVNVAKTSASIITWGPAGFGTKWVMRTHNGPASLRIECGQSYIYGTTDLVDGEWHHVAAVLEDDGSPDVEEIKLYVDGVVDETGASNPRPVNTAIGVECRIAYDLNNTVRVYQGLIDDVRIYDRSLSVDEIQALIQNPGGAVTQALRPDPADGAIHEFTWSNLSRTPGFGV